jgi:hypothetical protein
MFFKVDENITRVLLTISSSLPHFNCEQTVRNADRAMSETPGFESCIRFSVWQCVHGCGAEVPCFSNSLVTFTGKNAITQHRNFLNKMLFYLPNGGSGSWEIGSNLFRNLRRKIFFLSEEARPRL